MPLVVGAVCSGTTLLRLMLDAHSQIAMAPETAFPESLFREALERPGGSIGETVVAMPKWPDLGIDRVLYLAGCTGRSGVEALRLVWKLYRDRHGKPIVGDKSPGYVRFLPTIQRALPEVRVIHLVRDGRDCFASQIHSRFSLQSTTIRSPARQAAEWCDAVGSGKRDGPALPAYLEVRYEELVLDTARVLERICDFLGVPFEPDMAHYHDRAAFALTQQPPDDTRVGRWRETLLPREAAEYETVAGPLLAEYGYEPSPAMLEHRDAPASLDSVRRSAFALAQRDYGQAKRWATRAFRTDPGNAQRMQELAALAEWVQDFPVHWRMEVACDEWLQTRFGGRIPPWAGEPLEAGSRLFVWRSHRHLGAEVRYAAAVSNLGPMAAHCTIEVDPRLVPLLKRRFPELEVVARDAEPPADTAFHATWELLGHYLLPSAAAMPRDPWLAADPTRVASFAHRWFPRTLRPRVAVAWHSSNADKSLPPLEAWRQVLAVREVEFVSAQHGIDPRGIAAWRGLGRRVRAEPVDLHDDLDRIAALLKSCDLLVAVSASQAHLAGALGVPAWVVMREQPRLSWPLGREKTDWYPQTRCRWVTDDAAWEPAMRQLAEDLRAWTAAWRRRR